MLSENRAAPRRRHDHGTSGARLAKNVHLKPRDVWTTRPGPAGGASGIVKGFGFDLLADDTIPDQ